MEHADYISDAVSHTKEAFGTINGIVQWVKLFLAIIVPIIAGIALATVILQIFIKPILVQILVTPDFGFTADGISYMLQYLAVLVGLCFSVLFPYYPGYLSRCMQTGTVPEVENSWNLFISGWKINALLLYYAIPAVVIFLLYAIIFTFVNNTLGAILTGDLAAITAVFDYVSLVVYIVIEFVTCIFLSLFAFIGLVNLSRTGSFKESVNMGNIVSLIRKIGWYNYILCIVIIAILALMILIFFLGIASLFGYALVSNIILFGLLVFVIVPFGVFVARYLSNIYDTAFIEPEEDLEEFDDF